VQNYPLSGKAKGSSRTFLIIEGKAGQPYFKILVDVRDFGKYLAVNQIKWLHDHWKWTKKGQDDVRLDYTYFSGEDATLFSSVVRMAVNDAVRDLVDGLGDQGKDPKEVLKGW